VSRVSPVLKSAKSEQWKDGELIKRINNVTKPRWGIQRRWEWKRGRKWGDERGQHRKTERDVREAMYKSKKTRPHSPVLFERLGVTDIRHIVCTFHSSSPSAWKHAMSYDPLPFILFVIIARCAFASSFRFSVALRQWADTLNISKRRITLRRFNRALIKKRWSYLTYAKSFAMEISFVWA